MKHRLILPGVIALVLLFAACSPPPPLRDDTLLQDTSLITNDSDCAPPCWRGITPGVTAWGDALTILEDDPTLENVTIQEDDESTAKLQNSSSRVDRHAVRCSPRMVNSSMSSSYVLRRLPR